MAPKLKDTFDVDALAKLLGLESIDAVEERNWTYIADAGSGAEDEDAQRRAEWEAQNELYGNWHAGVTSAAEELFGNIKLALVPVGKGFKLGRRHYDNRFKVVPATSWEDAAEAVRVVIDGMGYAHVGYDLQEFLELGPYTPRQAVLEHLRTATLGYPEVYGSISARRIYENAW